MQCPSFRESHVRSSIAVVLFVGLLVPLFELLELFPLFELLALFELFSLFALFALFALFVLFDVLLSLFFLPHETASASTSRIPSVRSCMRFLIRHLSKSAKFIGHRDLRCKRPISWCHERPQAFDAFVAPGATNVEPAETRLTPQAHHSQRVTIRSLHA